MSELQSINPTPADIGVICNPERPTVYGLNRALDIGNSRTRCRATMPSIIREPNPLWRP
jgi:hypothetical protein